jgi:hypothetical protein
MGAGRDVVRRFEPPQRGENEVADERCPEHLLAAGSRHRHRSRRPFLEQELGGLDHGMGVKAPPGSAVVNHVAQGNEAHPLMMGHVGADHGHPGVLR